jgi:small subunit ribosomal protein S27Ae
MQIFINHLDGSQSVAQIGQETTIESLLAGFNASNCRVVYQGACLTTLDSLSENANLYLTGDLEGGKKKKKKKVYTTKKKNKHIHKRVKLGIYTLYSVDGTPSPTQARVASPSNARPARHAAPAPSWPSTGTGTTAASATPPSRWTPKPSRRTNKS